MKHREVGTIWDQNADTWTRLSRLGYDRYRDCVNTPAFFSMLAEVVGLRGLDIGCGDGYNTRLLAHKDARMTAFDIIDTGFVLERLHEPRADEKTLRAYPALRDSTMIAYFPIIRCRKPAESPEF